MKSLDTNILLYAINKDCPEHTACSDLVRHALGEPEAWIIADQVWFELYRLLRNPRVLSQPLEAPDAAAAVSWYRNKSGWLHCSWDIGMFGQLEGFWKAGSFPARRSFDLVLATTLKNNGVKEFHTRNTKDFEAFDFFTLVNPLA
jgi:toxin-antitoxin system PIN domain toxin